MKLELTASYNVESIAQMADSVKWRLGRLKGYLEAVYSFSMLHSGLGIRARFDIYAPAHRPGEWRRLAPGRRVRGLGDGR